MIRNTQYESYRAAIAGQGLPAGFLDLDLFDANIRQVAARAGGKRVRVASKSLRCRAAIERILAAGAPFAGVMCYTAPEAVFLSRAGLGDLLVAYPCWGAAHVREVCAEARAGRGITLMVDSPEQVQHLAAIAAAEGVTLPLCLDVDMSVDLPGLRFGVWRSGVRAPADALRVLAAAERAAPHVRLEGVMGYEAQVAGVGDNAAGQRARNLAIRALKRWSLPIVAARRGAVVRALRQGGAGLRFVNGGGTGSLETTRREEAVTELTAGSAFYAPTLFDSYRRFRHHPAAGFALEITRRPAPGYYTCLGGGYVASGPAGPERLPVPYLPGGARLTALEGAGEVQTPVWYDGPEQLGLGDPVFFRHAKAGELCEHFDRLLLLSQGRVAGEAPTYRGEGYSFL